MYGYKAQYRRMMDALAAAQREHGDTLKKEDELITFFMHCWHLKDHLRNDPTVSQALRVRLTQAVHSAPSLRIAQKIANGTKHYNLGYSVSMRGAHDLTIGPLGGAPQAKTYPRVGGNPQEGQAASHMMATYRLTLRCKRSASFAAPGRV